jgi:hypothetical protein
VIGNSSVIPLRSRLHWTPDGPVFPVLPFAELAGPGILIEQVNIFLRTHWSGESSKASRILDEICALLSNLVRQRHGQFLSSVLLLVEMLQQNGQTALLDFILDRLCVDASAALGTDHCLSLALASLIGSASCGIAEQALQHIGRVFTSQLPATADTSTYTLSSTIYRVWCLYVKRALPQARDLLRWLHSAYGRAGFDETDFRMLQMVHISIVMDITEGHDSVAKNKLHALMTALDRTQATYNSLAPADDVAGANLRALTRDLTAVREKCLALLSHLEI